MIWYIMALGLLPLAASAQGVYRCGSTFSDQSCGPTARQIVAPVIKETLPADNPPPEAVIAANLALCEATVRRRMKDPGSAKITPIGRGGPDFMYRSGQRVQGVTYHVAANGKNSYGGYTGEKIHVCAFDAAERTLIFTEETDQAPR